MAADWVARGIAIGGVATAVASLGWNVLSWRRSGPVIRATATCTGRGAQMTITGRLVNKGRFDAEVERAYLAWMAPSPGANASGKWIRCDLPAVHLTGIRLPGQLKAGRGAEFTISDIEPIDIGLNTALHDARSAQVIFVTATGRRAKARVKYGRRSIGRP